MERRIMRTLGNALVNFTIAGGALAVAYAAFSVVMQTGLDMGWW